MLNPNFLMFSTCNSHYIQPKAVTTLPMCSQFCTWFHRTSFCLNYSYYGVLIYVCPNFIHWNIPRLNPKHFILINEISTLKKEIDNSILVPFPLFPLWHVRAVFIPPEDAIAHQFTNNPGPYQTVGPAAP
jgi:hypothetical protein